MRITLDGQAIEVTTRDKNIVDVADQARVSIPAGCYRAQKSKGCCCACVVEIDGQQKFACATAPEDGMDIVIDRPDLKAIRRQRFMQYRESIQNDNPCQCDGSDSTDGFQ